MRDIIIKMESNFSKPTVIAIDGYSSCGKSTFAKKLATLLNYTYIDSGAMYRAVTLFALQNKIDPGTPEGLEALIELLPGISVSFEAEGSAARGNTLLNGANVENEIRGVEVSSRVSEVSKIPQVRAMLVNLQRRIAGEQNIVMDGRDIGTVVFPDADLKIFMTASPNIRAQRRYDEYTNKGQQVSFGEILENIRQRDHLDETRKVSPLQQAADAVVLDNSDMTPDEQLTWIRPIIKKITGQNI